MVNSDATLRVYLQYYEKEINLTRLVEKAYHEASVIRRGPDGGRDL